MAKNEIKELISFLQQNQMKAVCNHCDGSFRLDKAILFELDHFPPAAKQLLENIKENQRIRKRELMELTAKKKQKIEVTTQSVNIGFILERLAPALPGFPFDRNDCRSLFDPIDYVIFEGLSKTGCVQKLFFVDIKTGAAKLKKSQKAIREKVEQKKVEWQVYDQK